MQSVAEDYICRRMTILIYQYHMPDTNIVLWLNSWSSASESSWTSLAIYKEWWIYSIFLAKFSITSKKKSNFQLQLPVLCLISTICIYILTATFFHLHKYWSFSYRQKFELWAIVALSLCICGVRWFSRVGDDEWQGGWLSEAVSVCASFPQPRPKGPISLLGHSPAVPFLHGHQVHVSQEGKKK